MRKLFFDHALLAEGWATNVGMDIEDGTIRAVVAGVDPVGYERVRGIALPGIASLHSHTFQRGMAGLGETRGPSSDSFWSWRQVMYRFVDLLTADDVEAIAAFAFMEMLEGGFTSVGEFHYLHHGIKGQPYANLAEHCERIAAAAATTGIGLTLLPVLYTHGGFGGKSPVEGQRRFLNDNERFLKLLEGARSAIQGLPGAVVGIAPHSLRAVSPEGLADVLAASPASQVHIHVAEQMREVEDCIAWSGQRPVEWLLNNTSVDHRWCLIHATHMNDGEAARLANSGAVAGICPITEANLGDGIFNAPTYLGAQGAYGVGSDSNVEISAPGELKQFEYSQRLALRARNVVPQAEGQSTGGVLYRSGAAGGAKALARGDGSLGIGQSADIVVLDAGHPDLEHAKGDRWLDAYIFASGKPAINSVFIRGKRLVEGGWHQNREAIIKRYSATIGRLASA